MNCIVTAGPTYEPLDEVRRLTNFSTGRLGTELSNFLVSQGHHVTLLIGEQASYCGERRAHEVQTFSTSSNLGELLQSASTQDIHAVFHVAAVGDFSFSKVWSRDSRGELKEVKSRKISTREGSLMVELAPTPKIIKQLRVWYPGAFLAGWKYEVVGSHAHAIREAERQLAQCLTDVCVVNGAAYGDGFGVVTGSQQCEHQADSSALFRALETLLRAP